MIKRLVIGLIIAVVVAIAVVAARNRSNDQRGQVGDTIRQARVERGEILLSVTATGSIVPRDQADLSFDLPGKVAEVWVKTGHTVKGGDELARLDDIHLTLQVQSARAALVAAQAQFDQLEAGARPEEIAIAKANLDAAEAQLAGSVANLREMESEPDENQVAVAEANLRAAIASVSLVTIQRDQIADGASRTEIAAAEADVAAVLAQRKIARDMHDQTLKCQTVTLPDGTEKQICPGLGMPEEQARLNLYAADEAVVAAQARLDQLLTGPTEYQVNTADANVTAATAQQDAAQAQLDLMRSGASAEQLQAAQATVAAFTAQRNAAQARLDMLLAGPTADEIAAAQAHVDQAQAALDMALAELAKATLVAPFGGVVMTVDVQPGQAPPVTLPAVTLADVSEMRMVVDVDEIDVARIVEGQEVVINVDALPDETISGHIERLAPAASQAGGLVVYKVTVALQKTEFPLRVGMSGTASITVERLADVLLVPNWAIRIDRGTGKTYVNLLRAGRVGEAEVSVGVRGEDASQVLSGLREGDVVVAGDVVGLRELLQRED